MRRPDGKNLIKILLILAAMSSQLLATPKEKYSIESVKIEGNEVFSDERLRKTMVTKTSSFFKTRTFYMDVFQNDLENLQRFYRQMGFLDARIEEYTVRRDTTEKRVHITIQVFEGPRTYIEAITIFGNQFFSEKRLMEEFTLREEEPLLRSRIESTTNNLLTLYANNGFLDADISSDVTVKQQSQHAFVDFIITEGKRYRIGDIHISGLETTQPFVVKRELTFRKGEVVDYSKLLKSQRELYLTGLFQGVFISLESTDPEDSLRNVHIDIREAIPSQLNIAVGYGTVEKARIRTEVLTDNFRGTARKLSFAAKASFTYRGAEASFTEPWTLGTPFRTDFNLSAEYLEEPSYNLRSIGGRLTIGRKFLARSNTTITYRHENNRLSDIKIAEFQTQPPNNIRSLRLSFIYDTRDNIFNTANGFYGEFGNEVIGPFYRRKVDFMKGTAELKYFRPLTGSTIFATAFRFGWITAAGGLDKIPLNERFYAGGAGDLRAFEYRKAGPLDKNGLPVGGKIKLIWNLFEIRQRVYKMFGIALFGEIGNIYIEPSELTLRNLRQSLGAGIRFNSPVGLLRLDLGVNPDPRNNEDPTQIYFSVGHPF